VTLVFLILLDEDQMNAIESVGEVTFEDQGPVEFSGM